MLPLWVRVDERAMAMKEYSPFPNALALLDPHDCLVSYPGYLLGEGSYLSAEVQLVYSTAPADWANAIYRLLSYFLCY